MSSGKVKRTRLWGRTLQNHTCRNSCERAKLRVALGAAENWGTVTMSYWLGTLWGKFNIGRAGVTAANLAMPRGQPGSSRERLALETLEHVRSRDALIAKDDASGSWTIAWQPQRPVEERLHGSGGTETLPGTLPGAHPSMQKLAHSPRSGRLHTS